MTLDFKRIRAICFDIDGTLSDTDDLWVSYAERALSPLRWMARDKSVRAWARWMVMAGETPGNVLYHLLDRLDLDDDVARVTNWVSRRLAGREKHAAGKKFWIIPGVEETVARLAEHYPLAVVSARGEHSTLAFLEQYGLRKYIGPVVTAQTCRYTKPYPDPVLWAAQELGVGPGECLMVGDTVVDVRAGQRAGAQTAAVLCGFGQRGELESSRPDTILNSTADLGDVLLRNGI